MSGDIAHGEDGTPVPVEQFDYDQVDRIVFNFQTPPEIELEQGDVDRALAIHRMLLQWVWQDGSKNADGLKIRAMLMCWIFLPELRPLTLSQLARGFGMDKQSLGRWVDDFKRVFPRGIRNSHMR